MLCALFPATPLSRACAWFILHALVRGHLLWRRGPGSCGSGGLQACGVVEAVAMLPQTQVSVLPISKAPEEKGCSGDRATIGNAAAVPAASAG